MELGAVSSLSPGSRILYLVLISVALLVWMLSQLMFTSCTCLCTDAHTNVQTSACACIAHKHTQHTCKYHISTAHLHHHLAYLPITQLHTCTTHIYRDLYTSMHLTYVHTLHMHCTYYITQRNMNAHTCIHVHTTHIPAYTSSTQS